MGLSLGREIVYTGSETKIAITTGMESALLVDLKLLNSRYCAV